MMIDFNQETEDLKAPLLRYFRDRAQESLHEIKQVHGEDQFKKRASAINRAVNQTALAIEKNLLQIAKRGNWENVELVPKILMTIYARNVILIESRNQVWPYEYMAFARRIGELWEPFCKFCFEYPLTNIQLFVPPLFSTVRSELQNEVVQYINGLNVTEEQKNELKHYYDKVWELVVSGDIKLELDLHFISQNNVRTNVDFKSGFGSNEKGNTNRLLMVATIYKNLNMAQNCILLVRSQEDENNNYFKTLKNSGVWNAYCGKETYQQIHQFTGHDLRKWINIHQNWRDDLSADTYAYLEENELIKYLQW